jgi:uridine kinase
MTVAALITQIRALRPKPGRLFVIAVSGYGGSGKSSLAAELAKTLGEAEVVSIDDFIVGPKHERSADWHTFDRERLRDEILAVAQPGEMLTYQQFQSGVRASHRPGSQRTITPGKYLIIEGCSVLHPDLMKYYDFSVWIDCPLDTARLRAEARDRSQGNDDSRLWDEVWSPNDRDYFNNYRPDRLADAIVEL